MIIYLLYAYMALFKLLLTLCFFIQGFPGLRGEKGDKGERGEKVNKRDFFLHIFDIMYIMKSRVVT